jgi:hypothetical protein
MVDDPDHSSDFDDSGMTMLFASRGCRRMASTLARVLVLGFRETRCRMPVGS